MASSEVNEILWSEDDVTTVEQICQLSNPVVWGSAHRGGATPRAATHFPFAFSQSLPLNSRVRCPQFPTADARPVLTKITEPRNNLIQCAKAQKKHHQLTAKPAATDRQGGRFYERGHSRIPAAELPDGRRNKLVSGTPKPASFPASRPWPNDANSVSSSPS